MDDNPRRDSVIFAAQLWQQENALPSTMGKRALKTFSLPAAQRVTSHASNKFTICAMWCASWAACCHRRLATPEAQELLGWGCGT